MENKYEITPVDKSMFEVADADTSAKLRYSTTADDVLLFNAINGSSESLDDYIDNAVPVEISDIVITTATVREGRTDEGEPDENTPLIDKPCCHFMTPDGKHLSSLANGIIRGVKTLLEVGFTPTPEHTIVVKFKRTKAKKGIAHTFDLVKRN